MVRVIDSSVALKWFLDEPGRDRALAVLAEVLRDPEGFAVPELFFFELAHVFNRLIPEPTKNQLELLDQLTLIGIPRFSMTAELLREVRRFQRMGLSGYDGAYVGLAKMLKGRWITFDQKAHAQISSLGLSGTLSRSDA